MNLFIYNNKIGQSVTKKSKLQKCEEKSYFTVQAPWHIFAFLTLYELKDV